MMLWRKLPTVALALCLLAGPALAGGAGRAACCARPAARPCCPMMPGGAGRTGAACALHGSGAGPCSLRPAGGDLAVVHQHPELSPRPAVDPRPGAVLVSSRTARLPEAAFLLASAPGASPETPPPRLLRPLQVA
ncbi:MAG TPA: hypothetical protein VFE33_36260 [Thermoanaerobaculia bacterium]|nr:hypothetical protein [Thermoanaerobaculia bacterium]